ncbi:MAG: ATP-binding protein [Deltaproteobacteria bacterium]|nr:ATP-binding protein [Deltaproteobacteria bacterium]
MLKSLRFEGVGPASKLRVDFSPRLNFLAGDNGFGKTFLLDVAWWVLTRTWARAPVVPHAPPVAPEIGYEYDTKGGLKHEYASTFDRQAEEWSIKQGRPPIPGMVLYAQVDGGFSVWDPARNYWKKGSPGRPPSYLFSAPEVWDGFPLDSPTKLCNGLIADWASWQLEKGEAFEQLRRVLRALAPSGSEPLEPGTLKKISLGDARRHPTLRMPYGQDVALVHASAGMRRVVALAYLLVWTWQEHVSACKHQGIEPAREIVFLVDEIEAHLHPQWQRRIVPALLDVMEALTGEHDVPVQLITATHSPLVLVSTESIFDEDRDAIWELDLVGDSVQLRESAWHRRGDANSWLTSSVFDLKEARSIEAEEAITEALALLRADSPPKADLERVDGLLRAALGDVDRFWVRWSAFKKSFEG